VVHARNDPFIPRDSLPALSDIAPDVQLWQPEQGGHVGFPSGAPPGHLGFLPANILKWFHDYPPPSISGTNQAALTANI
jgi:predicted alpha/beta-fold hydrolase